MFFVIFQSLFYFLPAYISNAMPVLLAKTGWLGLLNVPVDFGYKIGGNDLFGKTKTYRGIVGGVLGGIITVCLQAALYNFYPDTQSWFLLPYGMPEALLLGFLLGLGEGLGDLIKSFVKRRLKMQSSAPCFPLDQTSFLGAVFLSMMYFQLSLPHLATIIIISPLIPVVANYVAYRIGWKKVWW